METCLITTVTMTLAMKGKGILQQNGIAAQITRLPPKLTGAGCAYGIAVDCGKIRRAKEILDTSDFSYGKIAYADGTPVGELLKGAPSGVVTGTPRATYGKMGGRGR